MIGQGRETQEDNNLFYMWINRLYFQKDKKLHIPQELRIRSRGTERHSASD